MVLKRKKKQEKLYADNGQSDKQTMMNLKELHTMRGSIKTTKTAAG